MSEIFQIRKLYFMLDNGISPNYLRMITTCNSITLINVVTGDLF